MSYAGVALPERKKRAAELLTASYARQTTERFLSVRFGNVFGSAGSVVPLFQQQIARRHRECLAHSFIPDSVLTNPNFRIGMRKRLFEV